MNQKYIAFLRGINVGGHHKVPMAELRKEMEILDCENVVTILNTGNIIFNSANTDLKQLEKIISDQLETKFGFPIPTILRKAEIIHNLLENNPFQGEILTKDMRWYISLLRDEPETELKTPWVSEDGSFKILKFSNKNIISRLDISITKTPKGMKILEKSFGKDITTRNWNTIKRIGKKLGIDS